jgi:hypothetical protein
MNKLIEQLPKVFLKPSTPGLKVPMILEAGVLPEEGKEVPLTGYWERRLKDGSVVRVDKTKEMPVPAPLKKKD